MKFTLLMWCASVCLAAAAAAPMSFPLRQAREAVVELRLSADAGGLTNVGVVSPLGHAALATEAPGGQTQRIWTIHAPAVPYGWTVCRFEFTPERDGRLTLTLTSPRETSTNGVVLRQEVAFDDVRVTGAILTNGGFEHYVGNRPVAWEGGGVANAGPLPPYKEANYARVWAERPLRQTIAVRGGVPHTLHFASRSLPVMGPAALRPLTERNTLAHQSAAYYRRGINVSQFLELPPGDKGAILHTEDDFRLMKREGFDHVRLPVGWAHHLGPAPEYVIAPEFLKKVDTVASNALNQGLFVIVNLHGLEDWTSQPGVQSNKFMAIWRQLARHYSEAHPGLSLELLHEPETAAVDPAFMNALYLEAIKWIRARNPMRTIFLGPGRGNRIEELVNLWLPPEEDNVIVTVRCHEPVVFTHQSRAWGGEDLSRVKGVVYPGPPPAPVAVPEGVNPWVREWLAQYNTRPAAANPASRAILEARLKMARDWSEFYGRPVHVGEFGATTSAETLSRTRYCRDFRQTADSHGLGWAMRTWLGGDDYWNRAAQMPMPGMREALFVK